jgi:hypothetical protein
MTNQFHESREKGTHANQSFHLILMLYLVTHSHPLSSNLLASSSDPTFHFHPDSSTQIRLKANNTSNSLQHLLRILCPIIILLLTIKILPIIKKIVDFPECRWSCRAVDIVIPVLVSLILDLINAHSGGK